MLCLPGLALWNVCWDAHITYERIGRLRYSLTKFHWAFCLGSLRSDSGSHFISCQAETTYVYVRLCRPMNMKLKMVCILCLILYCRTFVLKQSHSVERFCCHHYLFSGCHEDQRLCKTLQDSVIRFISKLWYASHALLTWAWSVLHQVACVLLQVVCYLHQLWHRVCCHYWCCCDTCQANYKIDVTIRAAYLCTNLLKCAQKMRARSLTTWSQILKEAWDAEVRTWSRYHRVSRRATP